MTLRIGGGDWRSWSDVAHTLVTERQNAQQLAIAAREAQVREYLGKMGLEQSREQFAQQMQLRQDQFAEEQYQNDLQASLAQQQQTRLGEDSDLRWLDKQAEWAVRMGVRYDEAAGEFKSLSEDDPLYSAYKEYRDARKTTANEGAEYSRKLTRLWAEINKDRTTAARANKRLTAAEQGNALLPADSPMRVDTSEIIKERDAAVERLKYNEPLYEKIRDRWMGDYLPTAMQQDADPMSVVSGKPTPTPTERGMPPPLSSMKTGEEPPPPAAAAAAAPSSPAEPGYFQRFAAEFAAQAHDPQVQEAAAWIVGKGAELGGAVIAPFEEFATGEQNLSPEAVAAREKKWAGRLTKGAVGAGMAARKMLGWDKPIWDKQDLEQALSPDLYIDNKPYFIKQGNRAKMAKDLQSLKDRMDKAIAAKNWNLVRELDERRRNYLLQNLDLMTQEPPSHGWTKRG